jgi:VanZ family protein
MGRRRAWLALLITILYAFSDEYHQTFVPGRHGQLQDVAIDMTGALLAMSLAHSSWGRRILAHLPLS